MKMAKKTAKKIVKKKVPQYFLRTTPASGVSGGQYLESGDYAPTIKWPQKPGSVVRCTDWKPTNLCGNGIHGYLFGEGKGAQLSFSKDAIWQVVEVCGDVVHIEDEIDDDKCKAKQVILRFSGKKKDAIAWLVKHAPGHKTYDARVAVGDDQTAVAGKLGIATAGCFGTAIAGDCGIATSGTTGKSEAGDYGYAVSDRNGSSSVGDHGVAVAGSNGTVVAGMSGTAYVGNSGRAEAGEYGFAVVRDSGAASAGNEGVAFADMYGSASAGDNGIVVVKWFDGKRARLAVGYVGEDGIKANTSYIASNGKLLKKGRGY